MVRLALAWLAAAAATLAVAAIATRQVLVASLPQTSGSRTLPGVSAAVRVDRDSLGIPTVRGASRLDVARATGFVHAQDRFFQMDLGRRLAAGELAALTGPASLALDKTVRVHRLRAVAREVLALTDPRQRALLDAYADGVNAGLAALGARPPEYFLLRATPERWKPEDCVLVAGGMFLLDVLWQSPRPNTELQLQAMYETLPAQVVDFLRPLGDEWDAPLLGAAIAPPPMPGPDVFDLRVPARSRSRVGIAPTRLVEGRTGPWPWAAAANLPLAGAAAGSNGWAVAPSHTADGRAVVANDTHLFLTVPNRWYRLSLEWPAEGGATHRLAGVSLAGLPFVVIGSNRHVAWGFTVAFDDRSDMVIVEPDARRQDLYRTPEGPRAFDHHVERIEVKGEVAASLDVTSTIWGPIVGRDHGGRQLAHQWQAHYPEAVSLRLAEIEDATSVEQALDIANRSGLPSYNMIAADDRGSIGWTITGRLPRRVGFDGRVPTSRADGTRRWDGWLEPSDTRA